MSARLPARLVAAIAAALVPLAAVPARAQTADVAAIQAREARNADERTLAALERFRRALVERYGGDPRLAMLEFGESEAAALVLASPGAAPAFVIWRGDRFVGTEHRRLVPWASPDVAAANAFALSSVRGDALRAWQRAWRSTPSRAGDYVSGYAVGYDPDAGRPVVRARVGSLATGRLSVHAFDPATGAPVAAAR